ncbi:MAG: Hsp70 family protein [Deltaproteobacteria bacterium]|nr:Hsp70 family protein [Deltaproteobacteria bacterium]
MTTRVALDLGTTNTSAAVVWKERSRLVPVRNRATSIPTAVAVDPQGRWLVGREARAQLISRPADTVVGLKTFLGRDHTSTAFRQAQQAVPYEILDAGGKVSARVGGSVVGLVEIAAMVLHETKDQVQNTLGQKLDAAIMPVPDYFTQSQRDAFALSARTAGFKDTRVVDESAAVTALVECAGRGRDTRLVFLYGLGGGAFTATVLERTSGGHYEIVASTGEDLGGQLFDREIARHLYHRFLQSRGIPALEDPVGLQRILDAAEGAKLALDAAEQTAVSVPYLLADANGQPIDLVDQLGRPELIDLSGDLVRRTLKISESALRAAGVVRSQIDAVYLYGRPCGAQEVAAATFRFFEQTPIRLPVGAPALGAAILAKREAF